MGEHDARPYVVEHLVEGRAVRRLALLGAALALGGPALWLGLHAGTAGDAGGASTPAPQSPAPPSVAVLPFEALSGGADLAPFAGELAEEITGTLARLEGLKVSARASSSSFGGKARDLRAIGARLGVAHLLEGTVGRTGGRLQVSARLSEARSGTRLWSKRFEREAEGLFALQDEIASEVAKALGVPSPQRPATHREPGAEAYSEYLRGRHLWRSGAPGAAAALERSLALDAGYAPAWALLTELGILRSSTAETPEGVRTAREAAAAAAERAVSLDPDLPQSLLARGLVRTYLLWDWQGALADLGRAAALAPSQADAAHALGELWNTLGKTDEAVALIGSAARLDPLAAELWNDLGWLHLARGEWSRARAALARSRELQPDGLAAMYNLSAVGLEQGDYAEARAWADRIRDALLARGEQGAARVHHLYASAMVDCARGARAAGMRGLEELRLAHEASQPYWLARLGAVCGERDLAFKLLGRSVGLRHPDLANLQTDVALRSLRDDPRWPALLSRMNLPRG